MAVVAALGGAPGTYVFSDALNHASIIDGARAAQRAGARLHVFRHRDMAHLEELLAAAPPGNPPSPHPAPACASPAHHQHHPTTPAIFMGTHLFYPMIKITRKVVLQ